MSSWANEEGQLHWDRTRYPEAEYNRRKDNIEKHGIHCKLQWFADTDHSGPHDPFYVLRVTFPEGFEHMIKPEAVHTKERKSSGFHISLGNRSNFHDNKGMLRELTGIYRKYKEPREVFIKHLWIAPSSVINVLHNDDLYKELADVVYHGTWKKDVHISMD